MQLHNIKRVHPNKKSISVGRGGTRGKTSGRGTKGQNSRAGHKKRPEIRDFIKRIPKRRGYGKNRSHTVDSSVISYTPINLNIIDKMFLEGEEVNPSVIVSKGIAGTFKGSNPRIKILGTGEITKVVIVSGCAVSASAKTKIEKAGGNIK
ncbi:MAG: uL15 family ribosomal protein [Patescibacteria group bacterium]|nr:uL15 family ribosomal protein [Patescibacteria group bacterium]